MNNPGPQKPPGTPGAGGRALAERAGRALAEQAGLALNPASHL